MTGKEINRNRIQILLQIQKLSAAVVGGASCLAEHPDHTEVRTGIKDVLSALESNLSNFAVVSERFFEVQEQIDQLLSLPEIKNPEPLTEAADDLLSEVSNLVNQALTKELKEIYYIEKTVAEELLAYVHQIPRDCASAYQLLMDVYIKCGFSVPVESFHGIMQIFEEQPALLGSSNIHPEYVYIPSEQRTFEACPVCGGIGSPYYCSGQFHMVNFKYPFLPAKLWMRCESCKNLYTWKFPEEVLALSEHSGMVYPEKKHYFTSIRTTSSRILSVWSDILNQLGKYTHNGKSLLEVGIGEGELLAVALEMGYDVDAVEIVPEAAQEAATLLGMSIWNGDFLKYETDRTYSVIIMGDVIEHVTEPVRALQKAYRLLDAEGVLWLSTPNFESAFSLFNKFTDPMWCEPYHITYFSRRGFEALAAQCGFSIQEYHVSSRYNGSMEMVLVKRQS